MLQQNSLSVGVQQQPSLRYSHAVCFSALPICEAVKRLLDVRTVVELLSDSYTDEGIDIWLRARNRNLNMQRPIDLIIEGHIEQVIDQAKWVAGGM